MKKLLFLILFLLVINLTQAQIVKCKSTPCSWEDLTVSISNLIRTSVIIAYWIAFLLISIGFFLMMLAGPSPSLYKKGKDIISIAIWGYILILISGIVIDIILEFFGPKFALAQNLEPRTYLDPLKAPIMSALKCGQNAEPIFGSQSLGRIFKCLFEAIALLRNIAVVLLVGAIIWAAVYLIATPFFGLKQISLAYKILIWSTIGLVVILLAELIRAQIERIVK